LKKEYSHTTYPFLNGGGEMGEITRNYDWASTSIGSPDQWPQSLCTMISVVLSSRFPMFLWWGDDLIQFYNDAYRPSLGDGNKHPLALGQKGEDCWPEIWDSISPMIQHVRCTGESTWNEDRLLPIYRNGKLEDVYWTFSYSPVMGHDGSIEGVLVVCNETTPKIQLLNELTEKEKDIRSIVESAPFPIGIYTGKDMKIEFANQTILDIWGKGDHVIGKSYFEILPELINQEIFEQLDRVYTTGIPYNAKNQYLELVVSGERKPFYFNYTFTPLYNSKGSIYGVMNTAADVTDLNFANQRIAEKQNQLLSLFEQSPVGIAILSNDDLTFTMANPFYGELAGRLPENIIGKPLLEALPELKGQGFDKLLYDVIETGIPYIANEVAVNLVRDGKLDTFYVDLAYQPYQENNNPISGVFVVAMDVTQQVLSRKKVEMSESSLRGVIEMAELSTWEFNIITNQFSYSPRFMEWLGFSGDITKDTKEAFNPLPPEYRKQVADKINEAISPDGNGIYRNEHPIINHSTGQVRIIQAHAEVLYDREGNPSVLRGSAQDITKERELQQQLAFQVKNRTEELVAANKDLAQANQNLQKSNSELAQFAYIASHDLQEPVRKISTFIRMLEDNIGDTIDERSRNYINRIHTSTDRMTNLIRDILGFSQLSKENDGFVAVDLNEIVKNILADFDLIIEQKNAVINYDGLPTIDAIPIQMSQLFGNLISNSLKYSREHISPVITITTKLVTEEERIQHHISDPKRIYYKIELRDNGIGFNQEYAEQIFNIFQRLHSKTEYAGTGIGLAMCKKITQNHHGDIYALASEKEGAVFIVLLPATQN